MSSKDTVDLVKHEDLPAIDTTQESPPAELPITCLGHVNPGFTVTGNSNESSGAPPLVYYSSTEGVSTMSPENCIITREDGSRALALPEQLQIEEPEERPLKEKDLRLLMIFSIVGICFFPPLGIAALVYARKTRIAYDKGILKSDLTVARKRAKVCERLIIFSFITGLMVYVIVFAVLERRYLENTDGSYQHSMMFGHRAP